MAFKRTPRDWDKFMKDVKRLEKEGFDDFDFSYMDDNGMTMEEIIKAIENGTLGSSWSYPGGLEQLKKDYESGMFDDELDDKRVR